MIAWLNGVVMQKSPPHLIIDVNGVGYSVEVSYVTYGQLPDIGEACALHIYTLVREDALLLFGFSDALEKQVFGELLKINGVGAKVALGILSGLSVQELIETVQSKSVNRLMTIPGIGKKTAERLLLEMADRFKKQLPEYLPNNTQKTNTGAHTPAVQAALAALGYSVTEAENMFKSLPDDAGKMELSEQVRWILRRR